MSRCAAWLADEGFKTDTTGGGDVHITPTENAQTLTLFQQGEHRRRLAAGAVGVAPDHRRRRARARRRGRPLGGRRVPDDRAAGARRLPRGAPRVGRGTCSRATSHPSQWIADNPDEAPASINAALEAETGKPLADEVITRALEHVTFSVDPHAETFETLVDERPQGGHAEGRLDRRAVRPAPAQRRPAADGAEPSRRPASARTDSDRRARTSGVTVDRWRRAPACRTCWARASTSARRCGRPRRPSTRRAHRAVGKRFGAGPLVLDDIDLDIAPGEFVCLLGASGCGKSTLLNLIAGLDRADDRARIETPAEGSAVMFQESALMPWLTARRNVELALRLRGVPRARAPRARRSRCWTPSTSRMPRRSVRTSSPAACASASPSPAPSRRTARVLLMDEPFAALDAITRDLLHEELERVWRATGRTIVFVTHNVREAARLGQRVVLLSAAPAGSSGSGASRRPTAAASSRPRSRRSRSRSPSSCGRRSAEMPHDTALDRRRQPQSAGCRRARRRPPQPRSGPRPPADRSRATLRAAGARFTTSVVPPVRLRAGPARRLAALRRASPSRDPTSCRARSTSSPRSATRGSPAGCRLAVAHQPRARHRRLPHRDRRRHADRAAAGRGAAAAPRGRADHLGPAGAAVGRVGARRDHLVRPVGCHRVLRHPDGRDPLDRQRPHRGRRPGAAAAAPRRHGARRRRAGSSRPPSILPAALPGYLAGLKQGWAFSWRSLMAAEIIATGGTIGFGLGSMLQQSRELADLAGRARARSS